MLVKVESIGWDIEEFEQCTRYNKMSFVFVNLYSRLENSSKLRSLRPLTPDLEQLWLPLHQQLSYKAFEN